MATAIPARIWAKATNQSLSRACSRRRNRSERKISPSITGIESFCAGTIDLSGGSFSIGYFVKFIIQLKSAYHYIFDADGRGGKATAVKLQICTDLGNICQHFCQVPGNINFGNGEGDLPLLNPKTFCPA